MKAYACVGLAAALALAAASAQDRGLLFSSPAAPPQEALNRLNLRLAWSAFVHTESRRDGLASIQLAGRTLLVQTRSGLVTALDAETGRTYWRTRFGRPFQRTLPLAINRKAVFAVNGTSIFALDRETGAQDWELDSRESISAPPVAGDYQLYIGFGNSRLSAYFLPQSEQSVTSAATTEIREYLRGEEQSPAYLTGTSGTQPLLAWQSLTGFRIEFAPVIGPKGVLIATPEGNVFSMEKFPAATRKATELFRYRLTDGTIGVAPGHYEEMAYIGARDSVVYAVNIDSGRVDWRYTAGSPIHRQPIATEKDVYVSSERRGLARVDRATGQPAWHLTRRGIVFDANHEADRFVAANPKFVYATDISGRLLVLDRATGLVLSSFDGTRDFTATFANALNDRIYLAANNGLIVCLHDRDYPVPFRHARGEERAIDPDVAEVETRLGKTISDSAKEPTPLKVMLQTLLGEKTGNIKFLISDNAFKEAGITDIDNRLVSLPKITNVPLRDVLRRVLVQVDATYQIVKDTILIYPAAKKAAPAAAPAPAPGPAAAPKP